MRYPLRSDHSDEGEVRIPTVEEINKMGRQVRQLVEAVLDLYLHKGDEY